MKKGFAAIAVIGFAAVATLYTFGVTSAAVNLYSNDASTDEIQAFVNFMNKFRKTYGTREEFKYRLSIFASNLRKMEMHNTLNSESSFRMGVNKFSDMTPEEYKVRLGLKDFNNKARSHNGENSFIIFNTTNLPSSVDWRPTGAVTKVKD